MRTVYLRLEIKLKNTSCIRIQSKARIETKEIHFVLELSQSQWLEPYC